MFIPPGVINFATNITSSASSSMVCDDVHHCRTIPVIIFSCASTMFLCTWVAYHPDVPKNPQQVWWTKLFRRIRYMLVALLAPEYIFFNAFIQWVDACGNCRDIIEEYPGCRLTETHLMFAWMGGFRLETESGKRQLRGGEFLKKLREGEIEMPTITESEIQDKSKSDDVAKAIALVQTLWFAVQSANRISQGLTVTEFELTTLGHVVLNIFIYWSWWKKPLNVNHSVPVYPKQHGKEADGRAQPTEPSAGSGAERDVESQTRAAGRVPFRIRIASRLGNSYTEFLPALLNLFIVLVIGGMFGAIHCLAWNSMFPSHAEHLLWRVSALVITAAPGLILFFSIWISWSTFSDALKKPWIALLTIIYCLARICLLILALIALRALPYKAYITPSWTRFIPHIG